MNLNEPAITLHGNTTDRPTLRYTTGGTAVAEFTVAQNPRYRDNSGQWRDSEATFLRVKAWRDLAESVCESLDKGHRVTVVGRIRTSRWQDKETGQQRSRLEVDADDVAVSLRGQRARPIKVTRETTPNEPPSDTQ